MVTFLGVHLLNLSRVPEPPLDHPNGHAHTHSTLEGGLLNPRLSLQGRMSLDGWNVGGDRGGIDIHMGGVAAGGRPAGRHGRQSSLYRAQSTTLFNAFEGEDDANELPNGPVHSNSRHGRQPSTDLHQLKEADEWEEDEGDMVDERTSLRKGKRRQPPALGNSTPPLGRNGGSRSHSHSPIPDSSLTDVRITPRS